jgi:Protein of unknown function (DUF3499)
MRICARSGCNSPAVAILSYDRVALIAYLQSVDDPDSRAPGDLCERHLGRLVIPRSWHLDDRRTTAGLTTTASAETTPEVGPAPRVKKVRAVPRTAAPRPTQRRTTRPKWAEVGPSLFDAPTAPAAVEPPAAHDSTTTDPVWMPRFGPDSELDGVLDAKTPLLRRAFGGR